METMLEKVNLKGAKEPFNFFLIECDPTTAGVMCVHVHGCVCMCVRACVRACMRAYMRTCMHACSVHVHACMCVCVHVCVHTCMRERGTVSQKNRRMIQLEEG